MATIELPWQLMSNGDNYLRRLIVNASDITQIDIYASATFDGASGTAVKTITYSPAESGAFQVPLDTLGAYVKVRAKLTGTAPKLFSFTYEFYTTRIQ